jgi:AcrR family transcriptional regulator
VRDAKAQGWRFSAIVTAIADRPRVKKPADSTQANVVPRILPRGRHKLDPQLVAASQRQRLLEAITELVAEKGYPDVTIRDIVTRAGTAKRTFYDHFADKLQCFLAALDVITDTLVVASARLFAVSGPCATLRVLDAQLPRAARVDAEHGEVFYLKRFRSGGGDAPPRRPPQVCAQHRFAQPGGGAGWRGPGAHRASRGRGGRGDAPDDLRPAP